jgi:hypothetical protein
MSVTSTLQYLLARLEPTRLKPLTGTPLLGWSLCLQILDFGDIDKRSSLQRQIIHYGFEVVALEAAAAAVTGRPTTYLPQDLKVCLRRALAYGRQHEHRRGRGFKTSLARFATQRKNCESVHAAAPRVENSAKVSSCLSMVCCDKRK